ncbi:Transport and Golgi organization protein 6 [Sparganum proliferum]
MMNRSRRTASKWFANLSESLGVTRSTLEVITDENEDPVAKRVRPVRVFLPRRKPIDSPALTRASNPELSLAESYSETPPNDQGLRAVEGGIYKRPSQPSLSKRKNQNKPVKKQPTRRNLRVRRKLVESTASFSDCTVDLTLNVDDQCKQTQRPSTVQNAARRNLRSRRLLVDSVHSIQDSTIDLTINPGEVSIKVDRMPLPAALEEQPCGVARGTETLNQSTVDVDLPSHTEDVLKMPSLSSESRVEDPAEDANPPSLASFSATNYMHSLTALGDDEDSIKVLAPARKKSVRYIQRRSTKDRSDSSLNITFSSKPKEVPLRKDAIPFTSAEGQAKTEEAPTAEEVRATSSHGSSVRVSPSSEDATSSHMEVVSAMAVSKAASVQMSVEGNVEEAAAEEEEEAPTAAEVEVGGSDGSSVRVSPSSEDATSSHMEVVSAMAVSKAASVQMSVEGNVEEAAAEEEEEAPTAAEVEVGGSDGSSVRVSPSSEDATSSHMEVVSAMAVSKAASVQMSVEGNVEEAAAEEEEEAPTAAEVEVGGSDGSSVRVSPSSEDATSSHMEVVSAMAVSKAASVQMSVEGNVEEAAAEEEEEAPTAAEVEVGGSDGSSVRVSPSSDDATSSHMEVVSAMAVSKAASVQMSVEGNVEEAAAEEEEAPTAAEVEVGGSDGSSVRVSPSSDDATSSHMEVVSAMAVSKAASVQMSVEGNVEEAAAEEEEAPTAAEVEVGGSDGSSVRVSPSSDDATSSHMEVVSAMAVSKAASVQMSVEGNVEEAAAEEEEAPTAAEVEVGGSATEVDLDLTRPTCNNQRRPPRLSLNPNRDLSPQPISPQCVWPSPVRKTGSCDFNLPAISGFKIPSRSNRDSTQPAGSVLTGTRTAVSSVLPSTTSTTSSTTRRVLSQEDCKEVEKLLLDQSAPNEDDLHLSPHKDRFEMAPSFVLPADFSVAESLDEDKLANLIPSSPLKHAVGAAAYEDRSRRRSVQFAPTADVYSEDARGQWDCRAVSIEGTISPILPSSPLSPAIPEDINILAGSAEFAPLASAAKSANEPSPSISVELENPSISKSRTLRDRRKSRRSSLRTRRTPDSDCPSPIPLDPNTSLGRLLNDSSLFARPSDWSLSGGTSVSPCAADPSKIGRQVRKCLLGWERPEDSIFIPLKPQVTTENTGLRRSQRIRIRPPIYGNQFIRYGERLNPRTGLVERLPIGYSFRPTDEEVRRRRRLLAAKQPSKARVPKAEMQRRLERLATKRRTGTRQKASSEIRVHPINLDDDVKWADSACSLPIGHLVDPKGPSDVVVILQPGDSTTMPVPESSMQLSTSTFLVEPHSGFSHSVGIFEVSENITHLVSAEQKARNLHFDSEAHNLFHLTCPPPKSESEEPVFAVQIGNYAIPITQICTVFVPKGLPYKFINSTSSSVDMFRVRLRHEGASSD